MLDKFYKLFLSMPRVSRGKLLVPQVLLLLAISSVQATKPSQGRCSTSSVQAPSLSLGRRSTSVQLSTANEKLDEFWRDGELLEYYNLDVDNSRVLPVATEVSHIFYFDACPEGFRPYQLETQPAVPLRDDLERSVVTFHEVACQHLSRTNRFLEYTRYADACKDGCIVNIGEHFTEDDSFNVYRNNVRVYSSPQMRMNHYLNGRRKIQIDPWSSGFWMISCGLVTHKIPHYRVLDRKHNRRGASVDTYFRYLKIVADGLEVWQFEAPLEIPEPGLRARLYLIATSHPETVLYDLIVNLVDAATIVQFKEFGLVLEAYRGDFNLDMAAYQVVRVM
eukprot:Lankesteria_metandrocarpae@DN4299_c0_g1_i3.p1